MTIKMTPPRTAHHMVNFLFGATDNMQEVSRVADVPVNLLWTARRKPNYVFRTPIYNMGLKSAYMTQRGFKDFPRYIENHLTSLRLAYELANANGQDANKMPLFDLLDALWPLTDQNNGNFSNCVDKIALHYLSGTMMLVADLQNWGGISSSINALERATDDFTAAGEVTSNPALRHRALLALCAAKQRKIYRERGEFAPLGQILDKDALKFLLSIQAQQTDNSITDALNALKLASVLENREVMLMAEKALQLLDPQFNEPRHAGWSPILPVSDDPDLAFYRKTKFH